MFPIPSLDTLATALLKTLVVVSKNWLLVGTQRV